jgi:rhamnogalacturonan endolyase
LAVVRASKTTTFVRWRLLGQDPDGFEFNFYRSVNGAEATKLNLDVLLRVIDFIDIEPDFIKPIYY